MEEQGGVGGSFLIYTLVGVLTFIAFNSSRYVKLKEENMVLMNALSAGMLVSCVLCVIIPEGFSVSSSAAAATAEAAAGHDEKEGEGGDKDHHHEEESGGHVSGLPLLLGYVLQLLLDVGGQMIFGNKCTGHQHGPPKLSPLPVHNAHSHQHDMGMEMIEEQKLGGEERGGGAAGSSGSNAPQQRGEDGEEDEEAGPLLNSPSDASSSSSPCRRKIVLDHHSSHKSSSSPSSNSSCSSGSKQTTTRGCCNFSSNFIGLLVHCLADGIALGASSLSSSEALRISVFLALVLHKVPVAFATGSLCHQTDQHDAADFRKKAIAFALASPLAAMLTQLLLGGQQHGSMHQASFIGKGLLFSAGTFTYVSVGHILPDLLNSHHVKGSKALPVLLAVLTGMALLPLLTVLGPAHEHNR